MGHHELRDDAFSSSSTTVPNVNTEDDAMLDAQLDAGSASHCEGVVAQAIRPSRHIKRASSSKQSKVKCNPIQCFKECFTKGEYFTSRDLFLDEETERWEERQQKSGAIGRLVPYHEGQSPKEDIRLRNGGSGHIILASLRDGGQAARAGVKAGDRLVSIDGKKDFLGLQAEAIQRLKAPVVLVFLGFVGKLEAEVRFRFAEEVCGISSRQEAVQGMDNAPMQLCEQRVFNVGKAHLFLAVMPDRPSNCHRQQSDDEGEGEKEVDDDEGDESWEDVEEEDEQQDEEEETVKREENKGRRRVHSIRSKRQKRQQPMPTKQKVEWKRTPGHSTNWTKHVQEVAPCFELQRSDAHQLVKGALKTIENGTLPEKDSLPSSISESSSWREAEIVSLSPRSLFSA